MAKITKEERKEFERICDLFLNETQILSKKETKFYYKEGGRVYCSSLEAVIKTEGADAFLCVSSGLVTLESKAKNYMMMPIGDLSRPPIGKKDIKDFLLWSPHNEDSIEEMEAAFEDASIS